MTESLGAYSIARLTNRPAYGALEVVIKIPGSQEDIYAALNPFWAPPAMDVDLIAPHGAPPAGGDCGYLGHPGSRVRLEEAVAGIPPPVRPVRVGMSEF